MTSISSCPSEYPFLQDASTALHHTCSNCWIQPSSCPKFRVAHLHMNFGVNSHLVYQLIPKISTAVPLWNDPMEPSISQHASWTSRPAPLSLVTQPERPSPPPESCSTPDDTLSFPAPHPQANHVICNAPLVAPVPLPYHSPTFLHFDLPDMDEDLSQPPYTQRSYKRKRDSEDVDDSCRASQRTFAFTSIPTQPQPQPQPSLRMYAKAAAAAHATYGSFKRARQCRTLR